MKYNSSLKSVKLQIISPRNPASRASKRTRDDIVSGLFLFCGTNMCLYVPRSLSDGMYCIRDANCL